MSCKAKPFCLGVTLEGPLDLNFDVLQDLVPDCDLLLRVARERFVLDQCEAYTVQAKSARPHNSGSL